MGYENLINKRIVIRCKNNMTFAGTYKGLVKDEFLMVETDQISGFSILCPITFLDKLMEVPVQVE